MPQNELLPPDMFDRRKDSAYDRVRLSAGSSVPANLRIFDIPVGKPCQFDQMHVKTYADTNMHLSGRFEAPQDMLVDRLSLWFQPSVVESDIRRLILHYSWELQLFCKVMARFPLLTGLKKTALNLGRYIPTMTPFSVQLNGEPFTLDADMDFYVSLDGLRSYPAQ